MKLQLILIVFSTAAGERTTELTRSRTKIYVKREVDWNFPLLSFFPVIHAALCEENLYGAADQAMQIEQTGSMALCQSLAHIHSYFSIKISTSWLIWRPLIFFLITFGDWVVTHIQTWRVALMMTWTCSLSRMQGYYLSKITFVLGKFLLWTYVVLVQINFSSFFIWYSYG